MIREHFIGRGMHLEFGHPDCSSVITSRILDIHEKCSGGTIGYQWGISPNAAADTRFPR